MSGDAVGENVSTPSAGKGKRPLPPNPEQPFHVPASIPGRAFAHVIDAIVLSVAWAPIGFIAARTIAEDGNLFGTGLRAQVIVVALNATYVFYGVGFVAVRGQTIGKMVMRIRVLAADGAHRPGWNRSLRRYGTLYGPGWVAWLLPLPQFIEGAAVMAWAIYILVTMVADLQRRGLHDEIANTRVVKTSG